MALEQVVKVHLGTFFLQERKLRLLGDVHRKASMARWFQEPVEDASEKSVREKEDSGNGKEGR